MNTPEMSQVIERAEHLLWVIARQDVECLSGHCPGILRRLRELEERARCLGVTDLYREVLRSTEATTKIVL